MTEITDEPKHEVFSVDFGRFGTDFGTDFERHILFL